MTTTLNSLQVLGRLGLYVYQRVSPGTGNVLEDPTRSLQKRLHFLHSTSFTPAQQARRQKFQAAVTAYRAASAETLLDYKHRASKRGLTAYNLFISDFLKTP